ncbi:MAG: hypothetical protein ACYS8W_13920 [Planctomycetota bacterium]
MADEKPYFEGEFYKPTFIFCCVGAGIIIILFILYITLSEEPKAALYLTFVFAFLGFALAALEKAFLLPAMKKWYYGMRIPFATEKFSVHAPERQMAKIGFLPDNIKTLHRFGRGQFMFTPKGYWDMHADDEEIGFQSSGRLVYAQHKDKAATTIEARLSVSYFPLFFIAAIALAAAASAQPWAIIVAIIGLVAFLILFYLRQIKQTAILKGYINAVGEEALKDYEKKVAEIKEKETAGSEEN